MYGCMSQIDLGNRSNDFSETRHEVGDNNGKKIAKPDFLDKLSSFCQNLSKRAKKMAILAQNRIFLNLRKNCSTK